MKTKRRTTEPVQNVDVVVLGGINTDFVVRGKTLPEPGQSVQGGQFFVGPGGKGANQAVAAARLGVRVAMIGRVGSDDRGREMLRALREEGVGVKHVGADPKVATGAAIIAVDESGEKQISAALGANLTLKLAQVRAAEPLIARAKVLLMNFEIPVPCVLAAARIARKYSVKVILDPAPPTGIPAELFPLLDAIRPNSDEAESITGMAVNSRTGARKAADYLLGKGVGAAVLEAGKSGNLVVTRSGECFLPRIKVKTVDATGAGDAFAGAFAAATAEGMRFEDAARFANAAAALATTRMGAQEGLPRRQQVDSLLRRQKC